MADPQIQKASHSQVPPRKMEAEQSHLSFLDLPMEVRQMVYVQHYQTTCVSVHKKRCYLFQNDEYDLAKYDLCPPGHEESVKESGTESDEELAGGSDGESIEVSDRGSTEETVSETIREEDVWPLLFVCYQVSLEARDAVLQVCTFAFHDVKLLLEMSKASNLPGIPDHINGDDLPALKPFNSIRNLLFDLTPFYPFVRWWDRDRTESVFRNFQEMLPALQNLTIIIPPICPLPPIRYGYELLGRFSLWHLGDLRNLHTLKVLCDVDSVPFYEKLSQVTTVVRILSQVLGARATSELAMSPQFCTEHTGTRASIAIMREMIVVAHAEKEETLADLMRTEVSWVEAELSRRIQHSQEMVVPPRTRW